MNSLPDPIVRMLRWSERYTKTDMVYLAESGLWINLGIVSVSLFSLLLYVVFARVLSPQTYGVYQYFLSAAGLLGALTLTGMNSAVTRAVARGHEGVVRTSVRIQFLWGLIPLVVALAIAAYYFVRGNEMFGIGFLVLGLFVPFNNALNTYAGFLVGKKDFKRAFLYNFGINLLFYTALIIAAFTTASALLLLAVNFISQAIGLYVAYRHTLKIHPPNTETDPETIPYGTHLSVMGILGTVAIQIDNFLVFHFLGPAMLAVYAFATALPDRLGGLLKFIPSALLPALSVKSVEDTQRALSLKRMLWIGLLLVLLGMAYVFAAPFLFALLFPAYNAAVPYSQIYTLAMVSTLGYVFSAALVAQRQVKSLYIFNTALPLLQIGMQVIGIMFYGLWGMIVAKILSSLALAVISGALLFKK